MNPKEKPARELEDLLEKKLIQRFCADTAGNADLGETLWQCCQETVSGALRRAIFRANSLCPDSCDRKTFLDASFSRAWEVFLKHICEFRELNSPPSLKAWLGRVAETAACNERRVIIGRGPARRVAHLPDVVPPGEDGESAEENDWLNRLDEWLTLLRERSSAQRGVMASPIPCADEIVSRRERKRVLRALIVIYGRGSPKENDSARFVRLWCWAGWTMTRIAEHRYGTSSSEREQNTKLKAISRNLAHDFGMLRFLLEREFGITSVSQI